MHACEFADLVAGVPAAVLAEYFDVDRRTVRRWKSGAASIPGAVARMARLRFDGDLSALGGKHWEHFRFGRDGRFYMPGWKYGWEPGELRALFFRVQLARHWEREAKRLERELAKLKAEAWAAAKVRQAVSATAWSEGRQGF